MKSGKCVICKVVSLVAAIGAINWGLLAFFQMDLVAKLFGMMTTGSKVAYGVIGVAGVMSLVGLLGLCPCQKGESCKK